MKVGVYGLWWRGGFGPVVGEGVVLTNAFGLVLTPGVAIKDHHQKHDD